MISTSTTNTAPMTTSFVTDADNSSSLMSLEQDDFKTAKQTAATTSKNIICKRRSRQHSDNSLAMMDRWHNSVSELSASLPLPSPQSPSGASNCRRRTWHARSSLPASFVQLEEAAQSIKQQRNRRRSLSVPMESIEIPSIQDQDVGHTSFCLDSMMIMDEESMNNSISSSSSRWQSAENDASPFSPHRATPSQQHHHQQQQQQQQRRQKLMDSIPMLPIRGGDSEDN